MAPVSVESYDQVARICESRHDFLLTTSSPDGDAVGSMLAFGLALKHHRKKVLIFSPEPFPENLEFLSGMDLVTTQLPPTSFDALIVMDTGSSNLLFHGNRKIWENLSTCVINIDHHPDNDLYGSLNLVFPESASTGEIVFHLISHLKWEISPQIAECLLTALMADTGAFRYPNVTSTTLKMAAELVEKGASNAKIARQLYASASPSYARLLGQIFANLHFEFNGRLAWSILTPEDFKKSSATEDTADKMVEHLDILQDVKVYALLRQFEDGRIKVSLRSRDNFQVNKIAAIFGGGGHAKAAGCQLTGSLQEAESKIVGELRKLLKQ